MNATPVDTTVDTTVNAATVGATVDATAEGGEVEHVDGEDNEDAMETTAVRGSSDAATSAAAASSRRRHGYCFGYCRRVVWFDEDYRRERANAQGYGRHNS